MWSRIAIIFIFVLGIGGGLILGFKSWNGDVTLRATSSERKIATDAEYFKKIGKISPKLHRAENVIVSHKVDADRSSHVSLQFGNYIDPSSGRTLCSLFDRVGMTFRSEGYAVNGDPTRIEFEASCPGVDEKNPEYITGMVILTERLCESQPDEVVQQVYPGAFFSMHNYDNEFPTDWVLENLSFYHSQNRQNLFSFDESKIRELLNGNLIQISCPGLY